MRCTGRWVVWDTSIGDRSKGEYADTSGPIVVKGRLIEGLSRGSCATYQEEMLHQRV